MGKGEILAGNADQESGSRHAWSREFSQSLRAALMKGAALRRRKSAVWTQSISASLGPPEGPTSLRARKESRCACSLRKDSNEVGLADAQRSERFLGNLARLRYHPSKIRAALLILKAVWLATKIISSRHCLDLAQMVQN